MWALWSLNERAAGREGADLPPPSLRWVADCEALARLEEEGADALPPGYEGLDATEL